MTNDTNKSRILIDLQELISSVENKKLTLDDCFRSICDIIKLYLQNSEISSVRILFNNKRFVSRDFRETPWSFSNLLKIRNRSGSIDVFYHQEEFFQKEIFIKEDKNIIKNVIPSVINVIKKEEYKQLMISNTERVKELNGISRITKLVKSQLPIEEILQKSCNILPEAWQYPEFTAARIVYRERIYETDNFQDTPWVMIQDFNVPYGGSGQIQVCYLKEFPVIDEGPFLKEERNLLLIISELVSDMIAWKEYGNVVYNSKERLKELDAINNTTRIISQNESIPETLQKIAEILPQSWQFPEDTAVRIRFGGQVYESRVFDDTLWVQHESFIAIDNRKGSIEVYYLKEFPLVYEGPFLKEERDLIRNIARLIAHYLNNLLARTMLLTSLSGQKKINPELYRKTFIKDKSPLQRFFSKHVYGKYAYHDIMKYSVSEILFVSTLYDAYVLESEGSFLKLFNDRNTMSNQFAIPRVTAVSSLKQAMELTNVMSFDLVILMGGFKKENALKLCKKMKKKHPELTIIFLISRIQDIEYYEDARNHVKFDNLFWWNGDARLLFAIIKLSEDMLNVKNDTETGMIPVILLVEDSPEYYSKYLINLYELLFNIIREIGADNINEYGTPFCLRARPKILLARNYEDAITIYHKYKENLLCVISDGNIDKNGTCNNSHGYELIRNILKHEHNLPCLLQSSNTELKKAADELSIKFIDKKDKDSIAKIRHFLNSMINIGKITFRDSKENEIISVTNIDELTDSILKINDNIVLFNAQRNYISHWLISIGEIDLARVLRWNVLSKLKQNKSCKEIVYEILKNHKKEYEYGKITPYKEDVSFTENSIITLVDGSLGGKGRGIAFLNALINNIEFSCDMMNIGIPITAIIGTNEYRKFLLQPEIAKLKDEQDYQIIRKQFLGGELSDELVKRLKYFLERVKTPVAIRSSGLFEDSLSKPLSGVYDTYILPNNESDLQKRLNSVISAIKLVFASTHSDDARRYFEAINHRIEDEQMAVVIQELAGEKFGNYYYPHISGIARSLNFYPLPNTKSEDGVAVLAFGLGSYVVDGYGAFSFCPGYPKILSGSLKEVQRNSQVKFYAVNLEKTSPDLLMGQKCALEFLDTSEAERNGTLLHCVSVYDVENDRLKPGLLIPGPRVIDFSDILQYDYIPLARKIENILSTVRESFGYPVEIEFAVKIHKASKIRATMYLLQVKPLLENMGEYEIDLNSVNPQQIIICSHSCLGNGKNENIHDIIYTDPQKFNKFKTEQMVGEIEYLNRKMQKDKRRYILIGFGRWGSQDNLLGIPVSWSQISNAKVVIEVSDKGYPVEASFGSHFFHNLTSMNVGYFAVDLAGKKDKLAWDRLNDFSCIEKTNYFIHVRTDQPLCIQMDGCKRIGTIHIKK